MESAPQSTITHNAVIEFASDPDFAPRHYRVMRRAHKKEACPAQKGGLKSAGPCQNQIPGATLRRAFGGVFRTPSTGFCVRLGLFRTVGAGTARPGSRTGTSQGIGCHTA